MFPVPLDTGLHSITERPDITGDLSDFDSSGGTLAFTDVDLSDTHTIGDLRTGFRLVGSRTAMRFRSAPSSRMR
jgi:hypothetical protein